MGDGCCGDRLKFVALTAVAVVVFFLGTYAGNASSNADPASFARLSQSESAAAPEPASTGQLPTDSGDGALGELSRRALTPTAKLAESLQGATSIDDKVQALQQTRLSSKSYVKKTVFKDTVRFLFVAGLEGSGHHAWNDLFMACWKESNACHVPQVVQKMLYSNKTWGLFNPITPKERVDKKQWMALRDRAKGALKAEEEKVAPRCLSILNVAEYINDVGQMSYPNYIHGPERSLRKPDLTLLANMAEEAGVDLRVLVLRRDAAGIYHSTVTHRHFMPGLPQTMVLIDNAHSLFGQLMSIDPKFVGCISNYGKHPNVSTRGLELASFLHPVFAHEKADFWRTLLGKIHTPNPEQTPPNEIDTHLIGRLQAATDLIDSYCDMLP